MDIKVPWIYILICKFTSVSQACTGHLYHYHNQHPVEFVCAIVCIVFFVAGVTDKSVTIF